VSKSIKQVLLSAAEYIERNGWVQGRAGGTIGDKSYPACAFGAIDSVSGGSLAEDGDDLSNEACDAVNAYLESQGLGSNLITYNDKEGRSREAVLDVLRGAAEWVGSQEVAR
jgi:hypothetical protein